MFRVPLAYGWHFAPLLAGFLCMHSKRTISLLLTFGLLAFGSIPFAYLFGADSASVAYLKSKPLSPWSIMALFASGEEVSPDSLKSIPLEKAIDLEAPILALTAAKKDPRTFGEADLIAKLKSFYDGTQLGEAGILNDDIFGLLALVASGEKANEVMVSGIKTFVLSKQNADGGFSFAVGGTSDTNTTAAAIMALRAAGVPALDKALVDASAYLKLAQNDDGGFPYDPKSSWGTASDASSDAWVMMAVKALGEDVSSWVHGGKTPMMHMESLKQENGSYFYQAGGGEDSFTPVTTSYALLALSGKTLPVHSITPEAPIEVAFSVQVEGKEKLLCDTDGMGRTALDALKKAVEACSLSFHVTASSLGDYVDEVAGEKASGASGWLYRINGVLGSVGAGAYRLQEGDAVRWYLGTIDGTSASDSIRTEVPLSVMIPTAAGESASKNSENNGKQDDGDDLSTVSMTVEVGTEKPGANRALGFGTVSRGGDVSKIIVIKNGGAVATTLSTTISGDAVFRRYLRLNEKTWRDYRVTLSGDTSTTTKLRLSIPADYSGSGAKSGAMIFWATPVAQ